MFSTGILSCRLTCIFHLVDFVNISYLIHFAITSLVTFAELCILLCYEVFILTFRKRVTIFVATLLFVLAQFCRSYHSFLISTFCTQFHCFTLNFTFLHWWNCTVHWIGINWHVLRQSDCRNCCLYIINHVIDLIWQICKHQIYLLTVRDCVPDPAVPILLINSLEG